ncbi:MAG: hypothetical protein MZV63_07155 [Marinilabiliales bacterium]|nr:hypothetical protein [Marinilabiliales bacterium]
MPRPLPTANWRRSWSAHARRCVLHYRWDTLVSAENPALGVSLLLIADFWRNRPAQRAIHPRRWVSGLGALRRSALVLGGVLERRLRAVLGNDPGAY